MIFHEFQMVLKRSQQKPLTVCQIQVKGTVCFRGVIAASPAGRTPSRADDGARAAYIIQITFGGAPGRVRAAVPPYGREVARDEQDGRRTRRTCARCRHGHASAPRRTPRPRAGLRLQGAARAAAARGRTRRGTSRTQRTTCQYKHPN